MATEQSAWYVNFFGEDYLNIYRHTLTAERTEKEVAFAERKLALDAGARVLDLCCGPGRHSVGAKSPLNLPPGLGVPQTDNGLLLSPILE